MANQAYIIFWWCANGFQTNWNKNRQAFFRNVSNDDHDELDAVHAYNNAIKLAREADDQGTVDLLTKILKMEEGHVDWAEIQRAQIEQMGIENYLVSQIESPVS